MIRTLIAEPTTLTREGVVALLGREDDIELVATVLRGEEVEPTARALRPDVALLATAFPGHDGITIAGTLHASLPTCRCAVLGPCWRPRDLRRAIAANVQGVLVHNVPAGFLATAEAAASPPSISTPRHRSWPPTCSAAARSKRLRSIARRICGSVPGRDWSATLVEPSLPSLGLGSR